MTEGRTVSPDVGEVNHPRPLGGRASETASQDSANSKAIAVSGLWMSYNRPRSGGAVHVLEDINFSVARGEFVCIVGPSGCGKTTLLNIAAGFLVGSQGTITVHGEPVRGPDRNRVFIFQEGGVFPWLTVAANIGFGLDHLSRVERDSIIRRYVEMVGLTGFEHNYPRELSGGMRQRVELARALAADPDILYMDEPFGALDYITRYKMRAELIRIWKQTHKTVLFVTHDIDEAVQLADRVLVMSRRPASIKAVIEVELPRPRDLNAPAYLRYRAQIFDMMGITVEEAAFLPESSTSRQ